MSCQQHTPEATDYEPARVVRVKKMMWSDQDQTFQIYYFHRIYCATVQEASETLNWLQKQFGAPCFQGTWWPDPATPYHIWCTDRVASSLKITA